MEFCSEKLIRFGEVFEMLFVSKDEQQSIRFPFHRQVFTFDDFLVELSRGFQNRRSSGTGQQHVALIAVTGELQQPRPQRRRESGPDSQRPFVTEHRLQTDPQLSRLW